MAQFVIGVGGSKLLDSGHALDEWLPVPDANLGEAFHTTDAVLPAPRQLALGDYNPGLLRLLGHYVTDL